jgi:hypothetical protein
VTDIRDLTPEMHSAAVLLFAQGYTVRYVRKALTKATGRVPTDQVLLTLAVQSGDDIRRVRQEITQAAYEQGLSQRAVRIMRLNMLAEEWEDAARTDPKAAKVYLDSLKSIREETEPLALDVFLPRSDPWAQLLTELKEATQRPLPALSASNSMKIANSESPATE